VKSIAEHPFGLYYKYKFRVTLNTDDRLMSNTTMTKEYKIAHQVFKLNLEALEKLTINAMKSAFVPYNRRIQLIYDVIKPGYAKARVGLGKKNA
jgi:adenosine deaminase